MTPTGGYAFFIRASSKPIEFEKGKAAIAVPSLDKLPTVIDTFINAVRNGELDDQLAHASKQASARRAPRIMTCLTRVELAVRIVDPF